MMLEFALKCSSKQNLWSRMRETKMEEFIIIETE
jgi:hypothetical protein